MSLDSLHRALESLSCHELESRDAFGMVPSENAMSSVAKLPMLTDVYHRYFFNDSLADDGWNFPGAKDVGNLETDITVAIAAELTRAPFVNVRPVSGLSAMLMVLAGLGGEPGSTVVTVDTDCGGHYATRSLAERLGLKIQSFSGPDAHTLNVEQLASTVQAHSPMLVYLDQSHGLFPIDVADVVSAVKAVDPRCLVHVDASHWMGLVLGGAIANPLDDGADSFGGSTHKSFPGPQKALVATRRKDVARRLAGAQFFTISSHHFAETISLGLAMKEFHECGGDRYARCVMTNAARFGSRLIERGVDVVCTDRGCTGGHQIWVRSAPGDSAREAAARLYDVGMRVNFLPDLPRERTDALRVGLNEPTWHGLDETQAGALADLFADVMLRKRSAHAIRADVVDLRQACADPYCWPMDAMTEDLVHTLLRSVTLFPIPTYAADGEVTVAR